MERLEALRPRVAALVDPQGRALVDRMLEDVFLEALYAVERKAMSMRLGRYQQDRAVESGESNGSPGPPNISP